MTGPILVTIESSPKKTFATAADWPGWSRSGKTEPLALEALGGFAGRYRRVAVDAGYPLADGLLEIVERMEGGAGTEFGVPSRITAHDKRPTSVADAARIVALVASAWATFDRIAAAAPAQLRKGPRGGGRDTAKVVDHVSGADHAYAREMGLRLAALDPSDRGSVAAMRDTMLAVLAEPSDGSPIAGRRWTTRYAAHRIAWHSLDHAWEIEDRTDPAA